MTPRLSRFRPVFASILVVATALSLPACGKKSTTTPPPAPGPVGALPGEDVFDYQQDVRIVNMKDFPRQVATAAGLFGGNGQPTGGEAPISLTCSDGTGLELKALDARTVVDGPLAFTELRLAFHNPQPRTREGRFAITLPPKAAISRFAMEIRGNWMEGEVVEKQRARQIYEDFLHRRQDPAILEQDAGNTFRARVFPIPANGDKYLIVSYSQEIADPKAPVRLSLRGLGKLKTLDLAAFVHTGKAGKDGRIVKFAHVARDKFTPTADLLIYPDRVEREVQGLRHTDLALVRVTARGKNAKAPFSHVAILFDTSASQAPHYAKRLENLRDLVAFVAKAGAERVIISAFDQGVMDVYDGSPAGFGDPQIQRLKQRAALGGSNLAAALTHVRSKIAKNASTRVILFGNGVTTVGPTEADVLRKVAANLAGNEVQRLDTVTMTTARDMDVLKAVAAAGLPKDGVNLQLDAKKPDFSALSVATLKPIDVAIEGAGWVWPKTLRGLQDGQSALVYAALLPENELALKLTGGMEETLKPQTQTGVAALLRRAWIRARIELLLAGEGASDEAQKAKWRKEAIELSTKHRVLCSLTALLVLETEHDYVRYKIDRTSLADILVVTPEGAAVRRPRNEAIRLLADGRIPPPVTIAAPADEAKRDKDEAGSPKKAMQKAEEQVSETYEIEVEEKEEPEPEMDDNEGSAVAAKAPPPAAAPAEVAAKRPRPTVKARIKAKRAVAKKTIAGAFNAAPIGDSSDDGSAVMFDRVEEEPGRGGGSAGLGAKGIGAGGGGTATGFGRGSLGGRLGRSRKMAKRRRPTSGSERRAKSDRPSADGDSFGLGSDAREHKAMIAKPRKEPPRRPTKPIKLRVSRVGDSQPFDQGFERALLDGRGVGRGMRQWGCAARVLGKTEGKTATLLVHVAVQNNRPQAWKVTGSNPRLNRCATQWLQRRALRHRRGMKAATTWLARSYSFGRVDMLRVPKLPQTLGTKEQNALMEERAEQLRKAEQQALIRRTTRRRQRENRELFPNGGVHDQPRDRNRDRQEHERKIVNKPAVRGHLADVHKLLATGRVDDGLEAAWKKRDADAADVVALVALGDALLAAGEAQQAARAYGSLIDLFPSRADLRRFAGNCIEHALGTGHEIAIDTYKSAAKQRPDHPAGHHMLAMALAANGEHEAALEAVSFGLKQSSRAGNFRMVPRILEDDMMIIGAAAIAANPAKKASYEDQLAKHGLVADKVASLRFILTWETDSNDVDFHIFDRDNHHASYRERHLPRRGGSLYADITTGYGPECFRINNPRRYPYYTMAHYYRMGPMGYGMGRLQVLRHDGKGGLGFESRPYTIMADSSYFDMGEITEQDAPIQVAKSPALSGTQRPLPGDRPTLKPQKPLPTTGPLPRHKLQPTRPLAPGSVEPTTGIQ